MEKRAARSRRYYAFTAEKEEGSSAKLAPSFAVNERGWILGSSQHCGLADPNSRVGGVRQNPHDRTPVSWRTVREIIDSDGPNTGYPLLIRKGRAETPKNKYRISPCASPILETRCSEHELDAGTAPVPPRLVNAILDYAERDLSFRVWLINPTNRSGGMSYCTIVHLDENTAVVHSLFGLSLVFYAKQKKLWKGTLLEDEVVEAKNVKTSSATVIIARKSRIYEKTIAFVVEKNGAKRLPDSIAALMDKTK